MNNPITKRINRDLGLSNIEETLADNMSGADFHSLLLAVLKRRVGRIEPARLSFDSPVTRSCNLDGRLLQCLEVAALSAVPEFEAIELSPVSPLGSVHCLTGLDQANVLSTVRAFECASDPTIGMALECVQRRKSAGARKTLHRLCSHQRVVRFPLPTNAGFTAHFKLFSMVSAGRDSGSFTFEIQALREHIESYLRLMRDLQSFDFQIDEIQVEISDTRVIAHLCSRFQVDRDEIRGSVRARDQSSAAKLIEKYGCTWPRDLTDPACDLADYDLPSHLVHQLSLLIKELRQPLAAKFPQSKFAFNLHRLTGLGYYQGPCFHIKAKNRDGQQFMLADGGFVDWTQSLLSDGKERLMTSAIGTELLCRMFGRA